MHGAQNLTSSHKLTSATQMAAQNPQPDSMAALKNMMKRMRDDVEKKILGKDSDTNIFKALNQSKEQIGGAIA